MKTVDTLVELIAGNRDLFAYLLPVANGEPIGPDGDVFEYGDEQLAELVIEMFTGETANWPGDLNRRVSTDAALWEKARTLTLEEVSDLSDEGWEKVREGLLKAHPGRQVPCMYCKTPVQATEGAIERHYRNSKCWDNKS